MLRAVSLLLILTIIAGVLFSCAAKEDEETDETTKSQTSDTENDTPENEHDNHGFIKDNLPDNLDFDDKDLTILYWSDYTMTEFFVTIQSGEIINDSIFTRNQTVEERLGVKLNYVGEKAYEKSMGAYMQAAEKDIQSGANDYSIYASYSKTIPAMSLRGLLADLMDIDYLDLDMPWWPKSLVEECTINNILYFCSGDISTNMLWMMIGTFFNIELLEGYGLESPYDLVDANQWTIDKLIEMTRNVYADNDGNNRVNDGDMFGFIIYNENIDAFFTSAGIMAIEKDNNGNLIISPTFNSERTIDLISKIGDYIVYNPGVENSSSIYIRDNFFNQNALMTMDRVFIVAGKDNRDYDTKIEFTYGLVPNAKYDPADEYYTNLGHPFTLYAISSGAEDADMAGAVLECLASESYRQVTPAVFETAMKIKYAHDEKTSQMYDIIRSTVVFDLGRLYGPTFQEYTSSVIRQQVIANSRSFSSMYRSFEKTILSGINKIMEAYS